MIVITFLVSYNRVATHMENREIREKSGKKYFDEKVRKIHEKLSKSGKNEIVLENGDDTHFVSIFCQRIRVISVTFCYTAVC